jgi:hypothetical protein
LHQHPEDSAPSFATYGQDGKNRCLIVRLEGFLRWKLGEQTASSIYQTGKPESYEWLSINLTLSGTVRFAAARADRVHQYSDWFLAEAGF